VTFGVDAISHATALSTGAANITWAHTNGANANKLVIPLGTGAAAVNERNFSGVAYNGIACDQVGEVDDGSYEHAEIWRLNNPATGSALNIVATLVSSAPNANETAGGAISFIDADAAEGAPSTNTATSSNPSVTVADSANGDIVVSLVSSDLGSDGTTNNNGVAVWEDEDVGSDSDYNCQRQDATGANTVCSWTANSTTWAAIGVAIKAAAAAATGPSFRERSRRPAPFAPGIAR